MSLASKLTSPEPSFQVTEWGLPDELIATYAGELGYMRWLELEVRRWEDKWRAAWIVQHPDGRVAMFSYKRYQQLAADMED